MSKLCPECKTAVTRVDFDTWVLRVRGSAMLDSEGLVESLSPLQSITTVKIGHELNHNSIVTCPHCQHVTTYKQFITVRTCWLTGEAATIEIDFPSIGKKWVSDDSDWKQFIELLSNPRLYSTNEEILSCVV